MIQKTYHFHDFDELNDVISDIKSETAFQSASGVLMQLYNPRLDLDESLIIKTLNDAFPDACISGVSVANLGGEKFDISFFPLELSVTFFTKTKLIQYDYNMETTTSFVAGRVMNEILEASENVKCLQVFYASNSISVNVFRNEFRHHKLPMFGIKAGRNINRENIAHVYGRDVYANGIVVVLFISTSLKLYMENNLGWQPIGREMTITKTEGDNVVSEIDKNPATEVYAKYLKVNPNQYFVQNVCDFPLILERNGHQIARVPAAYTEDGQIVFASDVHVGDHFRLSYATPEQLFALTEQSVKDLDNFCAEAVYLFECGNRVRFLNNKYVVEIAQYLKNYYELSLGTGYSELFVYPDEIDADLNSSLLVVGLNETDNGEDVIIFDRQLPEQIDNNNGNCNVEIPFLQRILAFLESTSKELDTINRELGTIAYTDQLTKIYNRWELERKIDESLELNRQGRKYGLLFFDIDHFKRVNDTYGHDMGDLALMAVVNLVRDKLEDGHAMGRWGGEEFIYMLPCDNDDALQKFAEEIRRIIDETCFVTIQHVTISIGATMAKNNDTMMSIVKRADNALYTAKETGRNKVVLN